MFLVSVKSFYKLFRECSQEAAESLFPYTRASLQKLTMMRILGMRSTEEGYQYQLLVNPDDHPECFEPAA